MYYLSHRLKLQNYVKCKGKEKGDEMMGNSWKVKLRSEYNLTWNQRN